MRIVRAVAAEVEEEANWQERHALVCELIGGLPWGEDAIDDPYRYRPGRLVPRARRALRGLDGMPPAVAADHLAECARHLLQLVEEARYPRCVEGYATWEYFREETEALVSAYGDEELSLAPRTLFARLRRAIANLVEPVAALEDDFDVVLRNGHRRPVSADKVGDVELPAGDAAILCSLLAVHMDADVVTRINRP